MPKVPGGGGPGRGGKRSHKGQRRMFTNEEELAHQHEQEEKKRAWRKQKGIESDEDDEEKSDGDGSSSSEDSDDEAKSKGVSHLIDIENPNRVSSKSSKKVTEMALEGGGGGGAAANPQNLSRREREEIEKQQAKIRYQQLHVQGKTDEARADLARLALIKKQREEAAKKREEDRKAKEGANKSKGKS